MRDVNYDPGIDPSTLWFANCNWYPQWLHETFPICREPTLWKEIFLSPVITAPTCPYAWQIEFTSDSQKVDTKYGNRVNPPRPYKDAVCVVRLVTGICLVSIKYQHRDMVDSNRGGLRSCTCIQRCVFWRETDIWIQRCWVIVGREGVIT
jgi:hypothetical protein